MKPGACVFRACLKLSPLVEQVFIALLNVQPSSMCTMGKSISPCFIEASYPIRIKQIKQFIVLCYSHFISHNSALYIS